MHCPFCRHPDSRVIDSRTSDDGLSIRRRRQCPECGGRFSTIETASLNVIKRSGVIESFSREKVMSGVRKACQGRPVTEGDLAVLAQKVEESVRQTGSSQVDTNEIGLAILGPLRELDEVAYLRFASVYQAFDSLEDFESAIGQLRADHTARGRRGARLPPNPERSARADSLKRMYPLLFRTVLSRMDPETAHHAAVVVIRLLGVPPFSWATRALTRPAPELRTAALGLSFESPFGVAAGFDKDVRAARGPVRARLRAHRGGDHHRDPAGRQSAPAPVPAHPGPRRHQPDGLQQSRRRGGRQSGSRSCADARRAP